MAMTAMEAHPQLRAAGASQQQLDKLADIDAVSKINWAALVQWVMTDGLAVIAKLISIFSPVTPPGPSPVQT